MNYRHIYHAGNFADVLKHVVLTRLIRYMQKKDGGFRVLDTHAGIGLYDLSSEEAQKTGEWLDGIGKLMEAELGPQVSELLEPYLSAIRELNPEGGIRFYPGSPKLARMLFRPQDRLSAMELHPEDYVRLHRLFEGDHRARITELDGWLVLGAHLPPKEKRGIVLVDPPFEEEDEYQRLAEGLEKAYRRFPGGTYCLWYPLKKGAPIKEFHEALQALDIPKMLCAELAVRSDRGITGLTGSGLVIVNPPFTLKDELHQLLPALKDHLAQDRFASHRAFWLRGENKAVKDD
ncbi:23S rRNA (adenine(2030)-N(6))-methyltransferase RlmJ [Rhizobium ruizarguesonis]|jgi:23S rRNA (adenine2030-N6)-methyltransferase|uniref:23S rRNA (adenine(2030)-N(6))-methyltransferase RlmJ n=1 Tax=Rhizobium ruizarguesonis TaxID=2081791 RepID=UPI00102F5D15|nr:23S rRNA (adenine(2030)-N(6))-methyltransferase RlmJ [Rhizobium ruizarguesonis]NEI07487.1 23S rRNA (adenine(2030)-N(6))-methyltransferase RlmJ [Rhizobium ruizarguesonis]NEI27585.1 23S rRNA (adenine(2030)-N(6))-methyltransferase RlmJ [Rhizobium ruizarguesonis]TAY93176.1 23S rRNA (adenine(2030)-N(6))-methyltransferase RlmJ [Rhizobium ruizarguesonis]TAZ77811.1 23S rRNA (adenine(2030)-N(6))-methyltransferase RlmJ [Rhizobium ruizarguesonis]TBA04187.1 23S rRNA (adenine(2030)-N(6))-methyltransfera